MHFNLRILLTFLSLAVDTYGYNSMGALVPRTNPIALGNGRTVIPGQAIGQGDFATVYSGTMQHQAGGQAQTVAIKIFHPAEANTPAVKREMEINRDLLGEPSVVQMLAEKQGAEPLIVFELASGGTLFQKIVGERWYFNNEGRIRRDIMTIAQAVMRIHAKGIFHGDMKPVNVVFKGHDPKIIDFGLSNRIKYANGKEELIGDCGTSNYAPPELFDGNPFAGTKADVWALGVILLEMAFERHSWSEADDKICQGVIKENLAEPQGKAGKKLLQQIHPTMSDDLEKFLRQVFVEEKYRYTAAEFVQALNPNILKSLYKAASHRRARTPQGAFFVASLEKRAIQATRVCGRNGKVYRGQQAAKFLAGL